MLQQAKVLAQGVLVGKRVTPGPSLLIILSG